MFVIPREVPRKVLALEWVTRHTWSDVPQWLRLARYPGNSNGSSGTRKQPALRVDQRPRAFHQPLYRHRHGLRRSPATDHDIVRVSYVTFLGQHATVLNRNAT